MLPFVKACSTFFVICSWHGIKFVRNAVCVLQTAVDVVTEVQKLHAQHAKDKQHMLQCLETHKQQATQLVNAALAEKAAACEQQVKEARAQAHR